MAFVDFKMLENWRGFDRMVHDHEIDQAVALKNALLALGSKRKLWVVSPERDIDVGGTKSTPDVILYLEGRGLIVLDFKATDSKVKPLARRQEEWDYKTFGRAPRQADILQKLFQEPEFRTQIAQRAGVRETDVPKKPPQIKPIVGFYNLPQNICDEWNKSRKEMYARRPVAAIGEETWKEAEDASRGEKLTAMIEEVMPDQLGRDWTPELMYAVLQCLGDLPPLINEDERIDVLDAESQHATEKELPRKWDEVMAELSSEEAEDIFETTDGDKILKWAVVAGPAGTGKTWLAAYGAMVAARSDQDVLLVFRSPHLTDQILSIITAFENEYGILTDEQRGRIVVEPVNLESDPGGVVGTRGWNAFLDRVQRNRFDVVLVDEAQDFSDEATKPRSVMSLVAEAAKEQGQVVLFGDREQVTSSEAGGIPWAPPDERVILQLRRNFRSQPLIVDSIMELTGVEYEIFQPELSKVPEDLKPRVAGASPSADAGEIAESIYQQLENMKERTPQGAVSGLTAVILTIDDYLEGEVKTSAFFKKHWPEEYRQFQWSTVDEFKGLEKNYVVLVVTSPNRDSGAPLSAQELKPHIYTGYSRARLLLGVIDATGLLG